MGGCSSVAGHTVHYGLAAGTSLLGGLSAGSMVGLSAVFLGASYGVWHRFLGGRHQSKREQAAAFIVQAGISVGVLAGLQMIAPHDHGQGKQVEWYQSLPLELRESMLARSRESYENLPANLRHRLDLEAKKEGIPPQLFMLTCSKDNEVSRDIAAYQAFRQTGANPAPGRP